MQIGTPSGITEGLVTIEGAAPNKSEQVNRQAQQQQETQSLETTQAPPPSGNIGQNIDTTA
ncbi:hypothetical protein [Planctobacterium marinum]|uniref:hypothetical protein n=1 Tax=Planctobacterium marinum TaxID=1631968 RepID=UPI001E44024F|nr:hypothetical protein [Planctobacterium marinum]MCC2605867.1 hypothetical protein [Planctobacterium marinum]